MIHKFFVKYSTIMSITLGLLFSDAIASSANGYNSWLRNAFNKTRLGFVTQNIVKQRRALLESVGSAFSADAVKQSVGFQTGTEEVGGGSVDGVIDFQVNSSSLIINLTSINGLHLTRPTIIRVPESYTVLILINGMPYNGSILFLTIEKSSSVDRVEVNTSLTLYGAGPEHTIQFSGPGFNVSAEMYIQGSFIFDGQGLSRVFVETEGSLISRSDLTIKNCILDDNTAGNASAVSNIGTIQSDLGSIFITNNRGGNQGINVSAGTAAVGGSSQKFSGLIKAYKDLVFANNVGGDGTTGGGGAGVGGSGASEREAIAGNLGCNLESVTGSVIFTNNKGGKSVSGGDGADVGGGGGSANFNGGAAGCITAPNAAAAAAQSRAGEDSKTGSGLGGAAYTVCA